MKQRNRILSLMLAILLVVGMLPISTLMVSAAVNDIFDDPASGLRFKVLTENGSIGTVSVEDGSYTGSSYTIPKEVTHNGIVYTVTEIGVAAFSGCTELISITIPDSVTIIRTHAFQNTRLTSVTIPDSVTTIDTAAFRKCITLTSVTIPSSVTTIGDAAFIFCDSLQTVLMITGSPKTIGESAFMDSPVTFTYKYATPQNLRFDGKILRWDDLGLGYVRYKVKLKNPTSASGIVSRSFTDYTNSNSYDLSGYMTQAGTYEFEVTAVLPEILSNSQPRYQDSETAIIETEYPFPVELPSVQVGKATLYDGEYTTDGQSTTTTKPESGGYAHFENGVLTLNNFTYSGNGGNGVVIYSTSDLTINAVGTNTINSDEKYAIYLKGGDLTIEGDVLNLAVRDAEKALITVFLYDVDGTYGGLNITDVTLNIDNNGDDQTYGIRCEDVLIDGSTLNVTMKKERQHRGTGLDASGTVAIKRNSQVVIDLSEVTNGTALIADENVSVSDSYVELRGDANGGTGLSFNTSYKTLDFDGGTLIIAGTRDPGGVIYMYSATIELPDGDYWWRTDENGSYTKTGYVYSKDHTYIELTTTDPHICEWDTKWSSDENAHWHECLTAGCPISDNAQKDEYGLHNPNTDDGDCTTEVTCTICKAVTTPAEEHSGGTATCTTKAKCAKCGEEYGDYGAHNWDADWTTDSEKHWHKCLNTGCTEIKDDNLHSGGTATCKDLAKCEFCDMAYGELGAHGDTEVKDAKDATCTTEGYTGDTYCKVCKQKIAAGTAIDALGHDYAEKLTAGADTHYYACSRCDSKKDEAAHSYQWVTDKEATASAPGLKHEECACGAKRNIDTEIPQPTTPPTGDNSPIFLWSCLLVASCVGIAAIVIFRKKRKDH